jgi:tagatose 1,6-diphosphate aldolase
MGKRTLSIGKYRALHRASTADGFFNIVALDHQDALRQVLNPKAPLDLSDQAMIEFKLDVVKALDGEISGALLDPVYGAAQAIEQNAINGVGLLLELEKADYNMEPLPLAMEVRPGWSVAKIKRMYADGVKVFFYYHPDDTEHAVSQEALVQKVAAECEMEDIPLYAEPIAYPNPNGPQSGTSEYAEDRQRVVVESAKRTAALGSDILKLEFPLDIKHQPNEQAWIEACRAVTEAANVPWVLLSAGVDYEDFCRQVKAACLGGASGFIAGRAVWGDACKLSDADVRREWFETEAKSRMKRLSEIVQQHATPWTDYYQPEAISTTWFKTYESGKA